MSIWVSFILLTLVASTIDLRAGYISVSLQDLGTFD